MSDYIKRDDAVRKIAVLMEAEAESDGCVDQPIDNYIEYASEDLADIPSADVAPVRHGRWIEYGENKDGTHNICCSVCDGFFKSKGHANSCYTRNKYRYCHNCGARMDGESDE